MNLFKKMAARIGGRCPDVPYRRPGRPRLGVESLEARDVPAAFVINGGLAADDFTFTNLGGGMVEVELNGAVAFSGFVAAGDTFTLNGLGSGDTFDIESVPSGITVTVNGGSGNEFIDIAPTGGNLDAIDGDVIVNGGSGTDDLDVWDSSNGFSDTFSVSGSVVDRNASSPITYSGVEVLTVDAGTGNLTFNVDGTAAGTTTHIDSLSGNDTYNITPTAKDLSAVAGALFIDGGTGTNTVTFDDANHAAAETYTVEWDTLSRAGMAATDYSDFATVNLNGGTAGSTFNVVSTSADSAMTITGGDKSDTFVVGATSQDLSEIRDGLTIKGKGGTDTLTLDDSAGSGELFLVSASTVDRDGAGLITHKNVEHLTVLGSDAFSDRFELTAAPTAAVVIEGGSGTGDTLVAPNQANTFLISGAGSGTLDFAADLVFKEMEDLEGNAQADTFKFANDLLTLTTPSVSGTIDGMGGTDTLDYSLTSALVGGIGVTVDMWSAMTASRTGGVANLENVNGTNGDDVIIGNSSVNVLDGNGGDDVLLGTTGNDTLIGDGGRDILVGGTGLDTLDGGADEDIVIGGGTTYGSNVADWQTIMNEWESSGPYLDRVSDLRGGAGLNLTWGVSVTDDGAADTLTGGTEDDWFLFGAADTVTDAAGGEQVN